VAILVVGTVFRLHQVLHPFDYRSLNPWREADYVQVARGYFNDRGDLFHPTIDWGGAGKGYVEMEFPFLPYAASLCYRVFSYDERFLRILSALCSVTALFVFAAFARRVLSAGAAIAATAIFSVHGLLIGLSGGIQPEPLQMLLSLLAVWAFMSWRRGGRPFLLLVASALCGVAILAKSPSALLGFVFAYFVLKSNGARAFRQPVIYLGALLALLPPLAWYMWAHDLFARTGLSLGLSNETHFINWEVLKDPLPLLIGLLRHEVWEVFAGFGLVLGIAGVLSRETSKELPLVWLTAGVLFYLVTIDTSGDSWAFYYHVNTVAPACLLMGIGFASLWRFGVNTTSGRSAGNLLRTIGLSAFVATLLATCYHGYRLIRTIDNNPKLEAMYECCKRFTSSVEPGQLILVRGGTRYDPHHHPVAFNESMAFAWMDRRGYNYPIEDYSFAMLHSFAGQGVGYWIASGDDVRDHETFGLAMRSFPVVDSCGTYYLLRLNSDEDR
jgi:hypothetical protein